MNILLTTSAAPIKCPFFVGEKRPPLGLGTLISLLRNEGHRVYFIDNYLKPSKFIEDGFLQKNGINYVGIYASTICYRDTLRMFNEIENLRRQGLWTGKIIVGGPHTAVAPETIPPFVDYVVQGEGERSILDIVNGEAITRIIRSERIKNLDSLPFQPWDIFTSLPYDYSCPWMDIKPVFTMNTSRGCPFGCSFCSVGSIWGREYTYMNVDRIIAEIDYLVKEFGAKGIYFREDNFTLNQKRTRQFCESLIRNKINIEWACETRVDSLSEELIELMSSSGCRALYLGIESGSQRILDLLNKGITTDQIENTLRWCRKYKVRAYCSLMTGIPGETYTDLLTTEMMMKKLKPYYYTYNVFIGIPNSSLYRHILQNNLHEYIDDIGLLYLPGYGSMARFFCGLSSSKVVEHRFKQRAEFDNYRFRLMFCMNFRRTIRNLIISFLPLAFRRIIKKWLIYFHR